VLGLQQRADQEQAGVKPAAEERHCGRGISATCPQKVSRSTSEEVKSDGAVAVTESRPSGPGRSEISAR
jgi:hypothetical protein